MESLTKDEVYEIWNSNPAAKLYVALSKQISDISKDIHNTEISIKDEKETATFERITKWGVDGFKMVETLSKIRALLTDDEITSANDDFRL